MKIETYRFGRIVIDGRIYKNDVMIYGNEVEGWWRDRGHQLQLRDLNWFLEQEPQPEVIVLGTGRYGMMSVPHDVIAALEQRGIEAVIQNTKEACQKYNELIDSNRAAAALHLTC